MIITTTTPGRDENKCCKAVPYGYTLILGKQSQLIRQTPHSPNPEHYFPPRHTSPLLNPERMGGDTAHSTTPRSTHSHKYVCPFSDKHPWGLAISSINVLPNTAIWTDAAWNDHNGTNTQRPGTRISYHPYRPASPCEYNLPIPCHPPVPILVRLKSGPTHLNVHMHHNTTEVNTNSTLKPNTDRQSAHKTAETVLPLSKLQTPPTGTDTITRSTFAITSYPTITHIWTQALSCTITHDRTARYVNRDKLNIKLSVIQPNHGTYSSKQTIYTTSSQDHRRPRYRPQNGGVTTQTSSSSLA